MDNSSPPPKRPRIVFNELPAIITTQTGTGPNPEDYIERLDGNITHNTKFGLVKSVSKFIIKDVPADPEGLLHGIFQFCIDEAREEGRRQGHIPDRLGCTISSKLLDPDIWIGIREITENTVDAILNRFLEVAQSKAQDGITLWGEPFTVSVTTVKRNGLPSKSRITGGAPRKLAPAHHRISQNSLIKIQNFGDQYCLFYALQATFVQQTYGMSKSQFYNYIHGRYASRGRFQADTAALMTRVEVPLELPEYEADIWAPRIIDHWNNKSGGRYTLKVFIFGSCGHYKPLFKYGPEIYDTPIVLYYDDKHFDGVSKMGGLFGQKYCLSCEKVYDRDQDHAMHCKARCLRCSRVGPKFPCKRSGDYLHNCGNCGKDFNNYECFEHHKRCGFCNLSKQCNECGIFWNVAANTRNGRQGHVCGENYCDKCNTWHNDKRGCFITPLEPKKEPHPCRYVSFDLETMQHEIIEENGRNKRLHQTNFVSARVTCTECIDNKQMTGQECKVCGPHKNITFSQCPFIGTQVDRMEISAYPLKQFIKWILYKLPKEYETIAFSHFGGRFDMTLAFKEIFLEGINPEMLKKGNKMYEIVVHKRKKGKNIINPRVTFRDSYNLTSMPLGALVPTFGLNVQDKPFFPFLANRPENYGKQIYPSRHDYLADGMMPEKRKKFEEWYEVNKQKPFLLDEELAKYCTNDTEILMKALLVFRTEFLDMSKRPEGLNRAASDEPHQGIDVLRESMTIASACMRNYRTNHLKKDHLSIVPERGYDSSETQSRLAFQFLHWYSKTNNVHVQTANSPEGEKKLAKYKLDGWVEETHTAIEVNGCAIHGCPKCYPDYNLKLPTGKIAGKMREKDAKRNAFIKTQVSKFELYWECEIQEMLEKDTEMRDMFDNYLDGPFDIRSCFFGGRTGPLKLYHELKPGEQISYQDVCSLYPFCCISTNYPVGIPKVHIINKEVNWKVPADNIYPLALLKVFVIPPHVIDIPVLPIKMNNRLLFPTCFTCAKEYPKGAVFANYSCSHSDNERGWVSSCTSIELNAALEEGYSVTKLFRVYEYEESDDALFRSYMAEFIAEKIHSSGFDASIKGKPELEAKFIRECEEMFGILVERARMQPNKGKRALAKLAVNNLWGRFSLRNFGLSKCCITSDPSVLCEYLDNRRIELTAIDELTPETILISYIEKKEWVEEHACSNVIISLWTTSAARLHLLKAMQRVSRAPGCTLLYTDTDSLIYVHPIGANPIPTGPHLGQFTDEFPGHVIHEFCSGGAKQYGLKLKRKDATEDFEYLLKVRGMTLNYDVTKNQGLRYETFKEKVLTYARTGQAIPIQVLYPFFLRPSIPKGRVISEPMYKIYKPFVGKGIVDPNTLRVLDFGCIRPQ